VKKRRLEGVVERLWGTRAEGKGPAATPFQQASAGPTASSAGQAAGATSSGSSRPPGQRGPMPAVPAADPRHANNREATLKYRNKKGAAAEASKAALGQAETENAALRARLQAMEAVKNQMRGEIDRLAKLPFKKR
jgi:hypothetical protein